MSPRRVSSVRALINQDSRARARAPTPYTVAVAGRGSRTEPPRPRDPALLCDTRSDWFGGGTGPSVWGFSLTGVT